ncbi:MAG: hypothetical protein R3A51_06250 [Nannocystaceae bacterium]|nr:hypothetical protein [Myxococcales bacterium]
MANGNKEVSLFWVVLGAAIIVAVNKTLKWLLAGTLLAPMIGGLGPTAGIYAFVALLAFLSFFGGGLLIGLMSPGETIREPAYAAVIAIILNGVVDFLTLEGEPGVTYFIGVAIMAGIGFLFALAGAYVGEKFQGETTDKMRERGEFGR